MITFIITALTLSEILTVLNHDGSCDRYVDLDGE